MADHDFPYLKLQLYLGPGRWLGPGKAQLLALIAETGSISAAGRRMGMSYKRAWMLVETLNSMFPKPLVESARGGAQGGGAHLTPLGIEVCSVFDALHRNAEAGARAQIDRLSQLAGGPQHR